MAAVAAPKAVDVQGLTLNMLMQYNKMAEEAVANDASQKLVRRSVELHEFKETVQVTAFAGTYASKAPHKEIERLAIQAAQVAFKQPERHEQAFKDFGIRMATQLSAGLGPPSDMSQHNT